MTDELKAWLASIAGVLIILGALLIGMAIGNSEMAVHAIENQCAYYDGVTGDFTWGNLR